MPCKFSGRDQTLPWHDCNGGDGSVLTAADESCGSKLAWPQSEFSAISLEVLTLPTSAGSVEALFLPAKLSPEAAVQPVMIGRSTGSPSELAIRTAMDAAFDRIARDPRVDRTRIFRFGQSLGDYFDNLGALAHFSGPVLVIHGRQDQLVPWEQGRGLALASAHSVFRLYDCGHGCWDPDRLPFWKDAEPFLLNAGILLHPHAGS